MIYTVLTFLCAWLVMLSITPRMRAKNASVEIIPIRATPGECIVGYKYRLPDGTITSLSGIWDDKTPYDQIEAALNAEIARLGGTRK